MIKKPYIFKTLDVSTGNIHKEDAEKLADTNSSAYELENYGWLVYIGEPDEIDAEWKEMSVEFRYILKEGARLGCDYVRFDCDGLIYDELPLFDW